MSEPRNEVTGASRRMFLKQSTAAVAGSSLVAALASRSHAAGSDEIRLALIGCGGRGTGAANDALSTEGPIKLVAMADAFADRLEGARKALKVEQGDKVTVADDACFVGLDSYKKALAHPDVNAVILATPPGFRPVHFAAAVEAGKNIFSEKPLATDAWGCRVVLDAGEKAKAKGLKVGVGLQRHHDVPYLETMKRIHGGEIGQIPAMRVFWNADGVWVRDRAKVAEILGHEPSEMEYQMYNWYYFDWLCGDHIVEQHIHNIDVALWAKNYEVPAYAVGMGGREVRKGKDHGQIFDHFDVQFVYRDQSVIISQCRHQPGTWGSISEHAHGTKAYANIGGAQIEPYGDGEKWKLKGRFPNPYQQEHTDLWNAVRKNENYSEVEYSVKATFASIPGRVACYTGTLTRWDDLWKAGSTDEKERESRKLHRLAPGLESFSFDSVPPVLPDAEGRYPVPVPGVTKII